MYEKVNPKHPDKVADRIAGAIVDLAYAKQENPKIAVEVLIGHGDCHIIAESSVNSFATETESTYQVVQNIVDRIAGAGLKVDLKIVPQDVHLAGNQAEDVHCGDNGIFCGMPTTEEQRRLKGIAQEIYAKYDSDGKYIIADDELVICQSNAATEELHNSYPNAVVNPLGDWTGGTDVDTGATNRKLGSDMGDAVTGGGLHGKDLSKADVSVNIYAHLLAQKLGQPVRIYCAIGDDKIGNKPYSEVVQIAKDYIKSVGGFEKFAEWGLI